MLLMAVFRRFTSLSFKISGMVAAFILISGCFSVMSMLISSVKKDKA
jgi:uncharacterized protein YceK